MKRKKPTVLVLSQVYVPDPASVGQHMHDAAAELARRGWRVVVLTSARGYDDPSRKYPARETRDGVEIRRLPLASFGKKSIPLRLLGLASFQVQAVLRGVLSGGVRGVLFSTSPPMIGFGTAAVRLLRRVPTAYWAMDLNPDQLVALGLVREGSAKHRALEKVNRAILRNSDRVIALDRFMADRLRARADLNGRLSIVPPWPHEQALRRLPHEENPWRKAHGLDGKFVVMYSGNHSPSNPLDTLLAAAKELRGDDRLRFLFVGGGLAKRGVETFKAEHGLDNIVCLPYQPMEELRYSLSAADVHVVSLGEAMVGIIHPCKVYGAMAVGRPVLFFGPRPSHVSDLLDEHGFGRQVAHGDPAAAVAAVRALADAPPEELAEMGETAQRVLKGSLSQELLCGRMVDDLEATFGRADAI